MTFTNLRFSKHEILGPFEKELKWNPQDRYIIISYGREILLNKKVRWTSVVGCSRNCECTHTCMMTAQGFLIEWGK
jgi:hypothetical protein